MDETQTMATTILLALVSNKPGHIFVFEEELCGEVVATVRGEPGVLDEPG